MSIRYTDIMKNDCCDCLHYVQHFVKQNGEMIKIRFGHCSKSYKIIEPNPCDNFERDIIDDDIYDKNLKLQKDLNDILDLALEALSIIAKR